MLKPIQEKVYNAVSSIFYQPYGIYHPQITRSQDNHKER